MSRLAKEYRELESFEQVRRICENPPKPVSYFEYNRDFNNPPREEYENNRQR